MVTWSGKPLSPHHAVLLGGLLVTVSVTVLLCRLYQRWEDEEFAVVAHEIALQISGRLETHVAMLGAGTGLFQAAGSVSLPAFRSFVASLDLEKRYPGIQGIGFSQRIPAAERADFEARASAAHGRRFEIVPKDDRSEIHSILYLEPLDRRNEAALGYDMFTESVRRKAMEEARDSGEPVPTGPVTLIQEIDDEKQRGFLIYSPVYEGDEVPPTVEERRRLLRGFVYAAFRSGDFIASLFGDRTRRGGEIELYAGPEPSPDTLVYSSLRGREARHSIIRRIDLIDTPWTVVISKRAAGTRAPASAWFAAIAGGLLSGLLALLVRAEEAGRRVAEEFATERGVLLEAERSARGEAERLGRLKDEFLVTLSHELRTPLNAMLGWVQLLRQGTRSAEFLAQGLEVIERNCRQQARLVSDLLDMSRIVSGKLRLEMQEVHLSELVEGVVRTLAPAAEAKSIAVSVTIPEELRSIQGDSARLQQVLWNLLSNAIKFTPQDGAVSIRLTEDDRSTHIEVADSGSGIPEEFLAHMFERFRQADPSLTRRFGGLGLGLAIVRQLVELHGGSVQASNRPEGGGAVFTVTLPRAAGAIATAAAAHLPSELVDLEGVKILVVDDEVDSREFVRRVLEERRAAVATAGSAAEAVAIFPEFRPSLLVSDIGMPGEDGYALLRRIRALHGGAIPALALTAFARPEDQRAALQAGYVSHLAKPVDTGALLRDVVRLTRSGTPPVGDGGQAVRSW